MLCGSGGTTIEEELVRSQTAIQHGLGQEIRASISMFRPATCARLELYICYALARTGKYWVSVVAKLQPLMRSAIVVSLLIKLRTRAGAGTRTELSVENAVPRDGRSESGLGAAMRFGLGKKWI